MNGPSTTSARCGRRRSRGRRQHVVDEFGAVAAAAGGDQDVVALRFAVGHRRNRQACRLQKADESSCAGEPRRAHRARSADPRNRPGHRPRSCRRGRRSCAARRAAPIPAASRCGASITSRRPSTERRAVRLEIGQRVLELAARPSGSLSTMNMSGWKVSAVCRMIAGASAAFRRGRYGGRCEVYSPLCSLITLGIFTKSTRARKSKAPAIGEPEMIRTCRPLKMLDEGVRDGAASAQMAEPESIVAVHEDARCHPAAACVGSSLLAARRSRGADSTIIGLSQPNSRRCAAVRSLVGVRRIAQVRHPGS